MNEARLHELSEKLHGRFKLAALVQKRLVQLMNERSDVITQNSGGRPVRLVIEEVAGGSLQLVDADGNTLVALPEGAGAADD